MISVNNSNQTETKIMNKEIENMGLRSVKFFADYAAAQYKNSPLARIRYKVPTAPMTPGLQPTSNPMYRCIICHEVLDVPFEISDEKAIELFQDFMHTFYDHAEIYRYEWKTLESWASRTLGKMPYPTIKQYAEKLAENKKCSFDQAIASIAEKLDVSKEVVVEWLNDDSSVSKEMIFAIHKFVSYGK